MTDVDLTLSSSPSSAPTSSSPSRTKLFDSLHKPYYIIPDNHDTGSSESGGLSFSKDLRP